MQHAVVRPIERVRGITRLALALATVSGRAGATCGDSPGDRPVYLSFDAFAISQSTQNAEVLNLPVTAERCGWTLVTASSASVARDVRPGDVLHVSLARLEPLIVGVKTRGMCFATLREHPAYRAQFAW